MSARGNRSPASPANEDVLTFATIVEKCEKTSIAIEEMKKLAVSLHLPRSRWVVDGRMATATVADME
jgi:hypothetical protein